MECSLQNCDRSIMISKIVLTLGTQGTHRGTQNQTSFLTRCSEQGNEFLDHIMTGEETSFFHMTPASKQQSMEWRHNASPRKKKFKQTMSTHKNMRTVFWGRKGVVLVEFLPRRETINRETYCQTLKKLCHAIQNRRCGMLTDGVVLFH